jgi:hypothetical protein
MDAPIDKTRIKKTREEAIAHVQTMRQIACECKQGRSSGAYAWWQDVNGHMQKECVVTDCKK